jgi:hypothetical protein
MSATCVPSVVEKAETALETQASPGSFDSALSNAAKLDISVMRSAHDDGVVVRANIETLRGRLKLALIAVS